MNHRLPKWPALAALLLAGLPLAAQAPDTGTDAVTIRDLTMLLMFATIMIAIISLILAYMVFVLIRARAAEAAVAAGLAVAQPKPLIDWAAFKRRFITDAVPVAQEQDIDMGHDYDGIRELDNNLPPWWKYGFYFTIAWSAVYLWFFHIQTDWSSDQQWRDEVAAAEVDKAEYLKKVGNKVDEASVVVLADASQLTAGKSVYTANCASCHGQAGEGMVGPNLTDAYWLHGGTVQDVFKVVKYGVVEKGMLAWQDRLSPLEMQQVTSYILTSLQGTNPPNAKAPQGELFTPADSTQLSVAVRP
ncbi:MAG: cbb3-type cytochrome c oxidase N-terminal domain-containing protein [Bacteroidia bacterium]|nr:cbb3-type cytochrome c oxidase N-terminal domain-containing protein [Bacteroidia bacterium]